MKNTLEDLWFSYLMEQRVALADSDKIIVNSLSNKREEIYKTLDSEQKNAFEKYEESSDNVSIIYEKQAFIKGVKFAANILLDALRG